MITFLILTVLSLTLIAIYIGTRLGQIKLPARSLLVYFTCFGFIAPIWLARAVWDTATARKTGWLT